MLRRSLSLIVLLSCAVALPLSAQSLVATITVPGVPNGIAVNPHNNRVYAAIPYISSTGGSAVAVIDGSSNTLVDTISIPDRASFVAVNMVTGLVYAASGSTVTVIDGTSDKILTTVTVSGTGGIGIQGITVNPVTNRIYVSDDNTYQLAVIDGYTNNTTYINTHNTEALGLSVDFATNQTLITPSGGALDIYNASTKALQQVLVGQVNQDVAVNSFTSIAYVTNNSGTTLGIVNLKNFQVSNVTVGYSPYGVCVDYLSNLIFVAVEGSGDVVMVDGSTGKVAGSVSAPSSYVDVNPATRTVYAASTAVSPNVVYAISE